MEEDKLDIDKLRKELRNATVNVNENTISTYGTVDADKLLKTVEHFRKVPTVEELINENNKLLNRLEQDERIIEEMAKYIKGIETNYKEYCTWEVCDYHKNNGKCNSSCIIDYFRKKCE